MVRLRVGGFLYFGIGCFCLHLKTVFECTYEDKDMKYKVTCFDSKTYTVIQKYWVTFIWDYLNHRWIERREDPFGRVGEHYFSGSPERAVERFLQSMNSIRPWQHWTAKPVVV